MSLQLLENKALSRGIIGKSAPILAGITIRKSQEYKILSESDYVRFKSDYSSVDIVRDRFKRQRSLRFLRSIRQLEEWLVEFDREFGDYHEDITQSVIENIEIPDQFRSRYARSPIDQEETRRDEGKQDQKD
jgi:hypothetical protein